MTDAPRTRTWRGIESFDPPALAHDFDALLAMARSMLESRRKGFPAKIATGELSSEDAAFEIAIFEEMVADWEFIASAGSQGEPAPVDTRAARRDALDASIATIAGIARSQRGFTKTLMRQAEAVIALRWHLEPGRDQVALARLTNQLRSDARAAQQKKAA
ncbi:hypothetical protein [Erythrobacter sp. EC-HK427]|uniref:hypothetical protein n=1 Tax=Erythrobacter sp. EC-HK427 TaxID=2038396 RepID=UPI00125B8568|nr:hypothetical protein [Erythrobacter sp. EC-HK427]VVT07190.1 conserved hypothetical protein [Erythrobacter sp. EC-HK427]